MYSEIIPMPRKRCIYEIDELFSKDNELSVIRRTESLIEFKRGSFWSLTMSLRKISLEGVITFGGNGKTTVNIVFDRTKFIALMIITTILLILIGLASYFTPTIFPYTKYTPALIVFWHIWGTVCIISPIILIPVDIYLRKKGERLFKNEIFLHLINLSYHEEI